MKCIVCGTGAGTGRGELVPFSSLRNGVLPHVERGAKFLKQLAPMRLIDRSPRSTRRPIGSRPRVGFPRITRNQYKCTSPRRTRADFDAQCLQRAVKRRLCVIQFGCEEKSPSSASRDDARQRIACRTKPRRPLVGSGEMSIAAR